MKYFELSEFDCPCCHLNFMDSNFLEKIDKARDIAKLYFHINSGYRCGKHNKAVGGIPNSSHLSGHAADIRVNSDTRDVVVKTLRKAGFKRIGIAATFVHADNDPNKDKATWYY